MDKATELALFELADAFRTFARIGRWGDCVACPRDWEGNTYPEFCRFTERYDHQIEAEELAVTFERYRRDARCTGRQE